MKKVIIVSCIFILNTSLQASQGQAPNFPPRSKWKQVMAQVTVSGPDRWTRFITATPVILNSSRVELGSAAMAINDKLQQGQYSDSLHTHKATLEVYSDGTFGILGNPEKTPQQAPNQNGIKVMEDAAELLCPHYSNQAKYVIVNTNKAIPADQPELADLQPYQPKFIRIEQCTLASVVTKLCCCWRK